MQKRLRKAEQKVGCDHSKDRSAAGGEGQNRHSFLTATGLLQFDPGCADVKAKLTVLTGVVYKK